MAVCLISSARAYKALSLNRIEMGRKEFSAAISLIDTTRFLAHTTDAGQYLIWIQRISHSVWRGPRLRDGGSHHFPLLCFVCLRWLFFCCFPYWNCWWLFSSSIQRPSTWCEWMAGGIFREDQKDGSAELAFKYAVYRLNRERTILPNTTLVYDIQYVPRDDSFRTSKKGIHWLNTPRATQHSGATISCCVDRVLMQRGTHHQTRWMAMRYRRSTGLHHTHVRWLRERRGRKMYIIARNQCTRYLHRRGRPSHNTAIDYNRVVMYGCCDAFSLALARTVILGINSSRPKFLDVDSDYRIPPVHDQTQWYTGGVLCKFSGEK